MYSIYCTAVEAFARALVEAAETETEKDRLRQVPLRRLRQGLLGGARNGPWSSRKDHGPLAAAEVYFPKYQKSFEMDLAPSV